MKRLSYANVTATLALVVAMSGVGYAATALPKHSVGGKQVINDSLRGRDIKESSLTGINADKLQGLTAEQVRFIGVVPQGVTIRGEWAYDGGSAAQDEDFRALISYGEDFGLALSP